VSTAFSVPDPLWNAWLEVDLSIIRSNIGAIRRHLGPKPQIMAVVKADAYGHGAVPVARAAQEAGATWLGVATVTEGVELRQAGIEGSILVMGAGFPGQMKHVVEHRLTQAISTIEVARDLSAEAGRAGWTAPVHLKVDTGMGRLGVLPSQAAAMALQLRALPNIELAGLFSHLASAGQPTCGYTEGQIGAIQEAIRHLTDAGITIPFTHLLNSLGTLNFPGSCFDMVRIGRLIYGPIYNKGDGKDIGIRTCLTWRARLAMAKPIPAGASLSYSGTYTTERDTIIGCVPVGYADGFPRLLSNQGIVLYRGQRRHVVGTVCMDTILVDLGPDATPEVGEEIVLCGRQGDDELTLADLADPIGTNVDEICARLGKRMPRYYCG
jgi:alanine racemase